MKVLKFHYVFSCISIDKEQVKFERLRGKVVYIKGAGGKGDQYFYTHSWQVCGSKAA